MNNGNRSARRAWASALNRHIKRGNLFRVEFHHDADCGIYTAACVCNCNCDRVLKDDTGKTLAAVKGAGFYDPLEFMGGC